MKRAAFSKIEKKNLLVSSLFILKDLFYKSFHIIWYIVDYKIKAIILVDTCTIGFGFINKKFMRIVYKRLGIQTQRLIKLKPIQEFDSRAAKLIIYTIYSILFVGKNIKSLASLLITKLGQYLMIFGHL